MEFMDILFKIVGFNGKPQISIGILDIIKPHTIFNDIR